MKSFLGKILAAKGAKIAAFVMAALVALTGGGASGYYIYGAANPKTEEPEVIETEIEETEVVPVEIVEEEEEEEEILLSNRLYLASASIDKDLKITVIDDSGIAVTGHPFEVYVDSYDKNKDADFLAEVTRQEAIKAELNETALCDLPAFGELEDAEAAVELKGDKYVDEDEDGIISITDIKAGEYKVALGGMSGYDTSGALQLAEVKGQIEYKVVDVTSQVKKESQVNAAIEDTAKKNVADEGGAPDVSQMLNNGKEENVPPEPVKVPASSVNPDVTKVLSSSASAASTVTVTVKKIVNTAASKLKLFKVGTAPDGAGEAAADGNENNGTAGGDDTQTGGEQTGGQTGGDTTGGDQTGGDQTGGQTGGDATGGNPTGGDQNTGGQTNGDGSQEPGNTGGDQKPATYNVECSAPAAITLYTNSPVSGSNATNLALSVTNVDNVLDTGKIAWSSSKPEVAAVSAKTGTGITVTAKAAGSASVTAVIPYTDTSKGTVVVKWDVTVNTIDMSKKLTDEDGATLYLDEELTKEATLADYNEKAKYYKEDTSSSEVSVKSGSVGIDVSKWNGSINWGAVASSGVSFAVIRCGYRGSTGGSLIEDPTFATNIKGAKAAGLKVGVYFFTQAINEAEAVEEASMAVSMAKRYGINMPIYIDTEGSGGRADRLSKSERTACIKAFCRTVASAGYTPGVYASKFWYYDNLNAGELSGYNIWVAQYAAACNYSGRYNMWQYTSKGSVPGVSGNVDMNIYY